MPGKLGRPAVVSPDGGRLDVFVRAEDRSLLHSSLRGGSGTTVNLGGELLSDPVAVAFHGQVQVFARDADQHLQTWQWDPELSRMTGPFSAGWLATDPAAVSWRSGRAEAFAHSVDGPMLWWSHPPLVPDGATLDGGFAGAPVPVSHSADELDVFGRSLSNDQLEQWQWDGQALTSRRLLGGRLVSDPVAVSWAANRIDVFARTDGGRLLHWGWDGRLTGKWFGPEPSIAEPLEADPAVASHGEDELDMFARAADGTLLHWSWDASGRHWVGPEQRGFGLASDPVAISRGPRSLDVLARSTDGGLLHWRWDGTDWRFARRSLALPPPPVVPWPADRASGPELMLLRPRDHVVLGVGWSGCRLVGEVPPVLEPISADARVMLTFPPQHVAEEVTAGTAVPVPPVDPATAGGAGVWRAHLAGPSRVTLAVPAGERIVLTGEGLLKALDGMAVLPGGDDPAADLTAIELPWGLIVAPDGGDPDRDVRAQHPSRPVELGSGAVGLWRTRLRTAPPAAGPDGGPDGGPGRDRAAGSPPVALRALNAGPDDPFPVPLSRAGRMSIVAQPTPATADRIELSALGGSLSVRGRWAAFAWDHDATLGRDQVVRTVAQGVLYPLGHRAEHAVLTERVIDPAAADPIAVLRTRSVLTVIEPVRTAPPGDTPLSRAFPFDEVEITKLVHPEIDPVGPGDWAPHLRPTRKLAAVRSQLDQTSMELEDLLERVHGDMGWGGIGPVVEQIAGRGPDPDDPDELEVQESAARFLRLLPQRDGLIDMIAALEEVGESTERVNVSFWPRIGDVPVRFPVRLAGRHGDVHVEMPLIFVQDERRSGDLREPFFSLSDPEVAARLADEYAGAGGVELSGTPIDLVRSTGDPRPNDVQEVHRLNVAAVPHHDGFLPRLGVPGLPALPDGTPDPRSWAVEVTLPAVRSLLGGAAQLAARVRLGFEAEYESAGESADVALRMLGDHLDLDFRGSADRSGGLVAPRIAADAVSRVHGLVNLAGSRSLDPATLLGDGASLLGFDLRSLVGEVTRPPAVVTDLVAGRPPVVTMTWTDIPLKPFPSPEAATFKPRPGSTMSMTVTSSPSVNEVRCTVRDFSIVMPPGGTPLLELSFGSLTFTQAGGTPPALDVGGVDARFVGNLALLQVLQEGVGLGSAGPAVDASPSGIVARYALPVPDVGLLAFTMRNLAFHAGVTVPFTGDPVSVSLGFGSRERPFTLGVLMFGGGGYVDLALDHGGLRRLEISLEFGAAVAIGLGIATAEVHALGGIRFAMLPDRSVALTGFLRIGGSVELLGLISVSVELRVELDYQFATNALVGRARLVIEVDLTLYSDSVELDSGDWVISGGAPQAAPRVPQPGASSSAPVLAAGADAGLAAWAAYRKVFVP